MSSVHQLAGFPPMTTTLKELSGTWDAGVAAVAETADGQGAGPWMGDRPVVGGTMSVTGRLAVGVGTCGPWGSPVVEVVAGGPPGGFGTPLPHTWFAYQHHAALSSQCHLHCGGPQVPQEEVGGLEVVGLRRKQVGYHAKGVAWHSSSPPFFSRSNDGSSNSKTQRAAVWPSGPSTTHILQASTTSRPHRD